MKEHEVTWLEERGAHMVGQLGVQLGDTIVDFGCGVGRYSIPLAKAVGENGTVHAIERGADDLAELKVRARRFAAPSSLTIHQLEKLDLEPIESASADFFFAFDVLQYVDDLAGFGATVDRVLKPAGLVHIYPAEIPHPGEVDMQKVTDVLKALDFESVESKAYDMMHNKFSVTDRIYTFRRQSQGTQ